MIDVLPVWTYRWRLFGYLVDFYMAVKRLDSADRVRVLKDPIEFEGFIEGAKAAGAEADGARLLDEKEFPCEKILKVNQLRIFRDPGIHLLLKRQTNIQAETRVAT